MRKGLILGLVFAAVMTFAGAVFAENAPLLSFVCPKLEAPIKIDGILDDAGWVTASAFGGKTVVDLGNNVDMISVLPRVAFYGYDAKNLYVAFVVVSDKALVTDATDWWMDDECEVFLAPDDSGYAQLGINTIGTLNYGRADWDFSLITVKASKIGVANYIELAIPFGMMGMKTPKTGDKMKIAFCGHQTDPDIWVAANAVYGGFHNPEIFSTMTFL